MSYVQDNLLSDEKVIHMGLIHWFVYLPGAVISLFSFFFLSDPAVQGMGTFLLSLGLALLLSAFIQRRSTELAVTNKRVIAKTGLIRRKTSEINHTKVEGFGVDQGICGRIFGYGTVTVKGTGGGKAVIRNIVNPMEFKRKSMETIDTSQKLPQAA